MVRPALQTGDRVQLSDAGRARFLEWRTITGQVVETTVTGASKVRVVLDGTRVPVWFPATYWEAARPALCRN